MMPSAEQREVQLAVIQSEIEAAPLLSEPVENLSESCTLVKEFANNSTLLPKVIALFTDADRYSGIRYVRRDGNCFFRCAVFALLERTLGNEELAAGLQKRATALREKLIEDYGVFVEDFCEVALDVIQQIVSGKCTTSTALHALATREDSEYMLYFYRYAVSNYIRTHRDDFLPFVMGLNYDSVDAFCRAEVDAVASESDHVQVVAFAKCFQLHIVVEYLDGSEGTRTTQHTFSGGDDACAAVTLLYRPGHYDLLYNNSRNAVASGVDLFGGMEILRTRHKKTAPSTAGSHTPFAESVASVQLKEPVSPVAPPKGDEPFFMRFDIKTDKAQDEVEDPKVTQMRQRLERYYKEYNPSKIPRLEDTLANYKGREDELFRLLVAKYGPEPEPLQASALPQNSGFFLGAHCEVGAAFDFIAGGTVQKNGNDQGCAANVSTGCSFTFMENNERGVAVPPQKSSPAGLDFCENAATAQPAFECTTGNSNAASGGLVVVPPSTGVTSHCEETEGKAAALEDVEVEKEGEAEEEEGTPQLKDATEAYNTNERDGENSHSGSANSKSGGDEEETLWGRQRQELLEAQRGVLVARACLTKVLDNVCAAIEERRLSMATVVDFEDRIERCVAQEAFEQADALSMELEQLGQRVAVLDAEPERLIALLAECRDELEAAVRRLAQLLQQHRQELIESKDSEERRVKKFISDVAFSLENRRDKVTAALERARRTESNSLQEVVNLRERNTRLEEKLLEQTSGLRASQEQLSREKAEIDTEIAALEARLEKLRQTRAEKAVALQDIELNLQHMTLEHNTLASEVNSLIAEEEIRLQAAATDLAQHQNEIETLHCEEDAFAAKRTALLRELQDGTAKIAVYEQRHALLATETVAAVRDYAAALTTILQARGAGCGVLFPAPPTINATVSPTESPLLQVHRLQQQLRSLDVADEQSEALIASLTIQVTGMRNKIPLLEAEKKGAVQAKRFKEAQLKAEEIRALTASIEELSAASAAAQAILSGNVEKRTLLQQQLAKERIKSVNRVQQFLDSYRDTLANAVQATAAPLNVLQLSADEQGPDDLAAAVRRLMTTLEEECRGVLQPDKSGAETTAITIARAAAPEEEVPLDLGETTTRAQLEAELSVLHMEQDAAAAREDFEECERLQDRIETLEARLCASE